MSSSANVRSVTALEDLKAALARFGGEAQEALNAAALEIRRTPDWLAERQNHWQGEGRRRAEDVRRAQAALARCQASGFYDREGRYHAPDCSAYENALYQAQMRLREAETELRNVQQWTRVVQQAVDDYQRQAHRLQDLTSVHAAKAQAFLERAVADLERYQAVAPASTPSPEVASSGQPDTSASISTPAITWAEQRAIVERLDAGKPITVDELRQLQQLPSDLQTGTLAQDEAWIHEVLEAERYLEAVRDSQEAQDLKEALLAALKAINYWRSKP